MRHFFSFTKLRNERLIIVVIFILVIASALLQRKYIEYVYEDIVFALNPSAEHAYTLGNYYFDAIHRDHYDIERAYSYFNQALRLDPDMPYVRHQLARIAFLNGNFNKALRLINAEIDLGEGIPRSPSSYYIRALIEAFQGSYAASQDDYKKFLETQPTNWAAINDYAWVLIQDGKARKAVDVTLRGLRDHPKNPWLLNTNATALFEIGMIDAAREQVQKAGESVVATSEEEWLRAYPGNDPRVAEEGLQSFKDSVMNNMHMMSLADN